MIIYGFLTVLLFIGSALGDYETLQSYVDLWDNHNYLVSLFNEPTKKHFCSGTFIYPKTVLTSASCLVKQKVDPDNIKAVFSPSIGTAVAVQEIAVHPGYDPESGRNDVAILRLRFLPKWIGRNPVTVQRSDIGNYPFLFAIEKREKNQINARGLSVVNTTFYTFCANYTDEHIPLQREFGGPIFNNEGKVVGVVPFRAEDDDSEDVKCYPRLEAYKLWIKNTIGNFLGFAFLKNKYVDDKLVL